MCLDVSVNAPPHKTGRGYLEQKGKKPARTGIVILQPLVPASMMFCLITGPETTKQRLCTETFDAVGQNKFYF